jgi:hypothetical protein
LHTGSWAIITVPVDRIIKEGRNRERGEEGKRTKKGRKRRKKERKKINHSNGSTHSLTKFTRPQVRFHKDINCLLRKCLS